MLTNYAFCVHKGKIRGICEIGSEKQESIFSKDAVKNAGQTFLKQTQEIRLDCQNEFQQLSKVLPIML